MHDRRIDGVAHTFGNYGALFMNAMTWWDHETGSVWSQPWGRGISGSYLGVELFLLPSQVTTWGEWRAAHPGTLAMVNDVERVAQFQRQGFDPNFVLGLLLNGEAMAFEYRAVEEVGVVNETLAGVPIVVWAEGESFSAFIRRTEGQDLTFQRTEDGIEDKETGSSWDLRRGLATEGSLRGTLLQQVPGSTAFDWAWLDFYPESAFFPPRP